MKLSSWLLALVVTSKLGSHVLMAAGCCSQKFKTCNSSWCSNTQNEAECKACNNNLAWIDPTKTGSCLERWAMGCTSDSDCCAPAFCEQPSGQCMYDPNNPNNRQVSPTPSPSQNPTRVPTPTMSPSSEPTRLPTVPSIFSTANTISSFEALQKIDELRYVVSQDPPVYAIVAEGGAAGNDVVSEGQGYGLLISGITLASMEPNDPNLSIAMDSFRGYFNGWKKMVKLSTDDSKSCQSVKFCDGGNLGCLPGWKFKKDLSEIIGTGSAPDGDQDAIVGMIFGVQALKNDANEPSWVEEIRVWADASSTQFMYHDTKPSSSGKNRIVKLGSCWGGWDGEGNNPSYHSPGSYRIMRDFQLNFSGRKYSYPNFNDGLSIEDRWNRLISTSYKYLDAVQCEDFGIVPNWATVSENSADGSLIPLGGKFSGSGTPQYEFGAEAGRTMWRVAFDAITHPCESMDAQIFLEPVQKSLNGTFDSAMPGGSPWPRNAFQSCKAFRNQPEETYPMSDWIYIEFMYSPIYSTLLSSLASIGDSEQQSMVDAAGSRISGSLLGSSLSYYHRSWSAIGVLSFNGDIEKASQVLDKPPCAASSLIPGTPAAPTMSPSKGPTSTPSEGPSEMPSKSPTPPVGCYSNNYKDCLPASLENDNQACNVIWLPTGSQSNCVGLWGDCSSQPSSCCGPATCFDDNTHAVCVPPSN